MAGKDDINRNEWKLWYDDLASKIEHLTTKLSTSEIRSTEYTSEGDDSDKVWQDLRAAQDSNTRISTDVDLLRKEMKDLKEKNAMMYKALMTLQSDNVKLREDVKTLQQRTSHREASSGYYTQEASPQTTEKLENQISTLESHISKLEQEIQKFQDESPQTTETVENQISALKKEIQTLRTEDGSGSLKELKSQVDKLEAQFDKMKEEETVHTGIFCDGCQAKDIKGTRYKCLTCSDYDLCEGCQKKGIHNQHDKYIFTKRATPDYWLRAKLQQAVAFTADLKDNVTTTTGGKLVCDRVLTNVGNGYSGETGVFTAPVSGTYCFILTVCSDISRQDSFAEARVMVGEDCCVAIATSKGGNWSTGHVVCKVNADEKVWLKVKVDGGKTCVFESDYSTFTGMLIQPDV